MVLEYSSSSPGMNSCCIVETPVMDDQEIISGLIQGAPEAAVALIDRFGQPLVRYFSVHLPDRSQAEDMAQEVFLRLIGSLKRRGTASANSQKEKAGFTKSTLFAPPAGASGPDPMGSEIRSLYSLIFTIARNLAIDVSKAAKRRPQTLSLDAEAPDGPGNESPGPMLVRLKDDSPDPRAAAAAQQEQARLEQTLRALPPETREILVLRHIEGATARDISQLLGIAEGTVWSRLNRGLEELRRAYLNPIKAQKDQIANTSPRRKSAQ